MLHVHRQNFISIRSASIGILAMPLLLTLSVIAQAQVNGVGPSSSSSFDNVINVPSDQSSISGVFGGNGTSVQVNVSSGGTFSPVVIDALAELNLNSGDFSFPFVFPDTISATSGGEVNVVGAFVDGRIDADAGSSVNILGGSVTEVTTSGGAILNVFDGDLTRFTALGGEVNIAGGTVGGDPFANPRSTIFSGTVNISGGIVNNVDASTNLFGLGSVVNLSGGTFGAADIPLGELNFRGGAVDSIIVVDDVNIFGTQFSVNGVPVGALEIDESFLVDISQEVVIAGVLEDGSPFEVIAGDFGASSFFDGFASDRVTLIGTVPEPSSTALLMLCSFAGVLHRRKGPAA